MQKALIEALKELARVSLLAAIPVLIDGLAKGIVDWRLIGISTVIAGLRFVDKLLHEWGKETNNEIVAKGLTRF